MSDLDKTNVQ